MSSMGPLLFTDGGGLENALGWQGLQPRPSTVEAAPTAPHFCVAWWQQPKEDLFTEERRGISPAAGQ